MKNNSTDGLSRREFLSRTLLTGAGMYLGLGSDLGLAAAEPPPETTTIRFQEVRSPCWVPQLVAEPLLRQEGFKDIQYRKHDLPFQGDKDIIAGDIDFMENFAAGMRTVVPGDQQVYVAGLHAGCYSLIGSDRIRSVLDLKGKKVWAGGGGELGKGPLWFFQVLVSYVGLAPDKDVQYVEVPGPEAVEMFKRGEIDAFMSFPPGPQKLRAAGIGHTLLDTNVDRPWSQYFCCLITGRRDFINKNPIATRKVLRSILRANDLVSQDPEMAAQLLVDRKLRTADDQEFMAQALREIPYDKWRHYSPEDTIRYYALRFKESGATKYSPNEIIEQNTDWSHLASLKDELGMTW
ncbi:ABC transporter substrate-binding protein [Candidatus Moduliflexota bacterium]